MEYGVGNERRDRFVGGRIGSGHEQAVASPDDGVGDGRNLWGRLSLAEDDFGKTLPP